MAKLHQRTMKTMYSRHYIEASSEGNLDEAIEWTLRQL